MLRSLVCLLATLVVRVPAWFFSYTTATPPANKPTLWKGPVTFAPRATTPPLTSSYKLLQADRGAWHVVKELSPGDYRPICEDGWKDDYAEIVCKENGYGSGRRTTRTVSWTDEEFVETEFMCLSGMIFPIESLGAKKCWTDEYGAVGTFPCSRSQGAAVYCYNHSFTLPNIIRVLDSSILLKKRWRLVFELFSVKYGREYNEGTDEKLKKRLATKDIKVFECGKQVKKLKLKINKMGRFTLERRYSNRRCAECITIKLQREDEGESTDLEYCFS